MPEQPYALPHADATLRDVGTWQFYDGALNDLELKADIAASRAGVCVLVVSDNCGGGLPARSSIDLAASVLVSAACEVGKYADKPGLPGHFAGILGRTLD